MKQYTYITNHKSLLGDLHTPVSTYLKVRDLFPQSVLMESSDYHGVENNRSFIGLNPIASIRINHEVATFVFPDGQQEERNISDDYQVEQAIREFISHFQVEGEYAGYCGLYGYTTFNAVRYFEKIQVKDSTDAKNDAPEILYILYKYLIVFNDYKSEMVLIEMLGEGEPAHLSEVEKAIHNRNYTTYDFRAVGPATSTLTDEEHRLTSGRALLIACGEMFSRLYYHAALSSDTKAMTSSSTVHYAASIRLHIFSISTLADSAFSVPRPKRTVR